MPVSFEIYSYREGVKGGKDPYDKNSISSEW